MKNSLISIVVPSVRSGTIADTIAAVVEQTDQDWELIISDQSGTEALLPMLEKLGDPRVRRAACPGRGASRARNFGVTQAQGDIIAFTDDDCRPRPNWVQTIRHVMEDDPDLWMATGSLVAPPIKPSGLYTGGDYIPEPRRARPSEGLERIYSVTANAAYRRIAFEKAGPFDVCFSPGTALFGGEEDDHGQRMELFDPFFLQTPLLEVEHTHGLRVGFKAVWDLRRKYAISTGALAAKRTLLGGDGQRLVQQELKLAVEGFGRRSPLNTVRGLSRAYFVRQAYRQVLRTYTVDQNLQLLLPQGVHLEQLYESLETLLDYQLPTNQTLPLSMAAQKVEHA